MTTINEQASPNGQPNGLDDGDFCLRDIHLDLFIPATTQSRSAFTFLLTSPIPQLDALAYASNTAGGDVLAFFLCTTTNFVSPRQARLFMELPDIARALACLLLYNMIAQC